MTIEEFEQLLEGQTETQGLDFKADCAWDVLNFAKDILAISNVIDGGTIIIGVQEINNAFVRKGVSETNKSTFKIDIMRDQMSAFADPSVDFGVQFMMDSQNLQYVLIKILPFRETPVMCRKDHPLAKVNKATIYYRNTDRRIESAAVSNTNDLRDIIELAALKIMQRRKEFGFVAQNSIDTILDNELGGL